MRMPAGAVLGEHLDPPRHRFHFISPTLGWLLKEAGFQIIHYSTFALEYDLFGWLQSALNLVCSRPNVLFEKLTSKGDARPQLPMRDVALSYALSPLILGACFLPCFVAPLLGQGGTLTVTCRASA